MKKLLECVPNISEGCNKNIIDQVSQEVLKIEGIKLLDVDAGKATNRTVITFVGEPQQVIDAAFLLIKRASELIDMSKHKGEHPRMGATDVCPLIPISNISLEEASEWAKKLGKRVGEELKIPVYLYEAAAQKEDRKNLAVIREGEYEGLKQKLADPNWKPDFGESKMNEKAGATVIGARDFLVAYNVNLNTTSTRRANSVAFDLRENGRVLEEKGKKVLDESGEPKRQPGLLKSVKAIGWFIEEYGIAQISMNLTDINVTPLHIAFDKAVERAAARGMRVTGSELVGLVPLKCMLDAADYFLTKQKRSLGICEAEKIKIAVKSMGLDELSDFNADKKIIEYVLNDESRAPLINMNLISFANKTASESPAPGGGSVSAYIGALGASLGTMVANLSSHKKGWDENWEMFSNWAVQGEKIKNDLMFLVDEDTHSFNKIMEAFGLPKNTDEEKKNRQDAIEKATLYATEIPLKSLKTSFAAFDLIAEMVKKGNPNSVTDAGVGALCLRSAVYGCYLNVKVNASGLKDRLKADLLLNEAKDILEKSLAREIEILKLVEEKLN
ncbi:MAG: glutamate formimidoyltransferase [Chitinophagaceae bacterium]|nr:glutamate formimidoyltransferase [Chitinophagaceae bacterium]